VASSVTPDVVLLDHWLGDGMTGLECLRPLRRQRLTRQPAVALITADWEVHDGDARELGAILVHKVCDLDQIHDTVVYLSACEPTGNLSRLFAADLKDPVLASGSTGHEQRETSRRAEPDAAGRDGRDARIAQP
jgi:hypothetical protein